MKINHCLAQGSNTRHNSACCVPTSNLICVREVAIRTTLSHMINIAGIIYYPCRLVIDIQWTLYKNAFNKGFQQIMCQNNCKDLLRKNSNGGI